MGQFRHLWNAILKEAGFPELASSIEVTLLDHIYSLLCSSVIWRWAGLSGHTCVNVSFP